MRRRARILLLLGLAAAGTAVAFAGALPEEYATVGSVVAGAEHLHGGKVTVKAAVVEVRRESDPVTFVVADGPSVLTVVWERALPEHEAGGSIEGRTVVVKGTLAERDGRTVLVGEEMQVGCASKYERA